MSPRGYRSELRASTATDTGSRILKAARSILLTGRPDHFTIDAIAEAAGVARMTVYHRFGSKRGLIEAVSDDLALRGGLGRLPEAFESPDALAGLGILIEVFCGFWASEGKLIKRLRALSTLDPELDHADRNTRRHQALKVLLGRLAEERGRPGREEIGPAADLILVLTSFDAYQSLAAAGRDEGQVAALITAAGRRLLEL